MAIRLTTQTKIDKVKDVIFKLPKGQDIFFNIGKDVFSIDENKLKYMKHHIKNRSQLLKEIILMSNPVDEIKEI